MACSFLDMPFLLGNMCLTFLHVILCLNTSFLNMTSSPIESYVGHSQVLVIIHKAAINIYVGIFIWTSSSCANLFPQKTYVTLPQRDELPSHFCRTCLLPLLSCAHSSPSTHHSPNTYIIPIPCQS